MNYWLIFLTGLTSGGISCAAMQGGLLASVIANQKQSDPHTSTIIFLVTKLISHVLLGALLGLFGASFSLSPSVSIFFQGFAALFMFATAMNLLEIHPIFRYLAFTPPRFVRNLIKDNAKSGELFAPAILGFFTIFIPCGVTQAMEVLALSSGSMVSGALIMGSFILGTAPMFALIGVSTAKLSEIWKQSFLRFAAVILIAMSLYSANGILQVIDSPYSVQKIYHVLSTPISQTPSVPVVSGTQSVVINIENSGYSPNRFRVVSGTPVTLTLKSGNVYSCAASFTFKAFGINTYLKPNTTQVFTFTPTSKGLYTFSCSMGMYSGTMEVI